MWLDYHLLYILIVTFDLIISLPPCVVWYVHQQALSHFCTFSLVLVMLNWSTPLDLARHTSIYIYIWITEPNVVGITCFHVLNPTGLYQDTITYGARKTSSLTPAKHLTVDQPSSRVSKKRPDRWRRRSKTSRLQVISWKHSLAIAKRFEEVARWYICRTNNGWRAILWV